jgi:hypothetical protein
MTPSEITTIIATGFEKTFDMPFKLMLMKRVDAYRSRFIRNTLEKDPRDRRSFIQSIYMNMSTESEVKCSLGLDALCDVAVTVEQVPVALRANGIQYDYVGAINGANAFQPVSAGMIGYANEGKYSKNLIQYESRNQRIVVHRRPQLPMIRIDAIFDYPTEVADFVCENNGNCNFWDSPYPCTNDIIQLIIQYLPADFKVLQEELSVPVNNVQDKLI